MSPSPPVGKRGKQGRNLFKQRDVEGALRIARKGGITPGRLEIIANATNPTGRGDVQSTIGDPSTRPWP